MELLFITKYLDGNIEGIIKELYIVLLAFIIVSAAIAIDLFYGIRRAKRLGVARTSYGFRRTVTKCLQYYSVMLFAFMLDVLASIVDQINMPYFSFIMAAFLVYIEFKSVRENISDKEGIKQQNKDLRDLLNLLVNRGDGLKALADQLDEKIKKDEKDESDEPKQ